MIWTSKWTLPERALGRLAHDGERLRQQVVERFAVGVALPELVGHATQFGFGELLEVLFDGVDLLGNPPELAQELALTRSHDLVDDGWHFSSRSSRIVWL